MTEWWQVPSSQFMQAKAEQTEKMKKVFQATPAAQLVLEKVITWYNSFAETPEDEVKIEEYYPFSDIDLDQEVGGHRMVALSVSGGDEGGPASVYSFWDYNDYDRQWELELILQEFDTGWSLIWGGEYASGKMGFIHQDIQVAQQEAQTTKIGMQEYSEQEQKLGKMRPMVRDVQ